MLVLFCDDCERLPRVIVFLDRPLFLCKWERIYDYIGTTGAGFEVLVTCEDILVNVPF